MKISDVIIIFLLLMCVIYLSRIETALLDYRPCRATINHLKYDVELQPGTHFTIYDCENRLIGGDLE